MDKDKTGGTLPPDLELEDILNEFAPKGKPSAELPKPKAPKAGPTPKEGEEAPRSARRREKTQKTPQKKEPLDPIFDTPPVEEPEEPTLRLLNKDGRLVRAVPVGKAPSRRAEPEPPSKPPHSQEPKGEETDGKQGKSAKSEAKAAAEVEEKLPWWKRRRQPVQVSEKVIELPDDQNLTGRIGRLMERADAYAENMFPDDNGPDPEEELRERLLPGVDYEEELTHAPRPRKKYKGRAKPDIPPAQLAKKLGRGLRFLHTRTFLSFLWCIPQLYLLLAGHMGIPMVAVLEENTALRGQAAAVGLAVSCLLALDVLGKGLFALIRLRLESETVLLFAAVAAIADALTMPLVSSRGADAAPYCGVVSVALFFALWSRFLKRSALRQSCRVAAGAGEPYLVTLDEKTWNGQDAYSKWSGEPVGYGSQVQEPDGAQRAYHVAAPVILLGCVLLALVASVGKKRPELFFWALSATLTAGCGFTAFLSFAMPFSAVTRRLSKIGGALGGWESLSWSRRGVGAVLTDGDLFPPGSVTLNGLKLTGDTSLETLVSYAATLVRETGSGMEKPFHDLLRTQGSIYRRCERVMFHEGGVTGVIGGREVYVGSGAFMALMKISLPQGLNVKNAVFCAVDGHLEGIFALNYRLHPAVRPALDAIISNGIKPILATRDFGVIPDMLRQRFKLPVNRVEFPSLDRRRELSSPRLAHAPELSAVLCREGLGPYAETVVGGRRLARATRMGVFFSLLGSGVGMALAFYLTAAAAFSALSAGTMLAFLLLWMVPAVLVSGWANRY